MTNSIANSEQKSDTPRQPLSPAMLAQAERIERGVCFGRNGTDEHIKIDGGAATSEWMIVTWRGTDSAE